MSDSSPQAELIPSGADSPPPPQPITADAPAPGGKSTVGTGKQTEKTKTTANGDSGEKESTQIREPHVQQGVAFMLHPKVKKTALSRRIAFLKHKGSS
jgi:peroxisomal membrane anchor protein 14 (PEX14)